MDPMLEFYRKETASKLGSMIESLALCTCPECARVPRGPKMEIIAQALVDVLAAHLFCVTKSNVDESQDCMIQARKATIKHLDHLFTNFGSDKGQNDGQPSPR